MNKKTKAKSKFHTRHALSLLLRIDRGTINRHLTGVTPDAKEHGHEVFSFQTLERAMAAKREKRASENALKDAKLEQEVRRLRNYNNQKEGLVVLRSAVEAAIQKSAAEARLILTAKLENEYPALVCGLDVVGIRIKGKQLNAEVVAALNTVACHWKI